VRFQHRSMNEIRVLVHLSTPVILWDFITALLAHSSHSILRKIWCLKTSIGVHKIPLNDLSATEPFWHISHEIWTVLWR
jgi:hypothetical protein